MRGLPGFAGLLVLPDLCLFCPKFIPRGTVSNHVAGDGREEAVRAPVEQVEKARPKDAWKGILVPVRGVM